MAYGSPAGLVAETIAESVFEASDFHVVAELAGHTPKVHLLRDGRTYTATVRDTTHDPLAGHPRADAIRTIARAVLALARSSAEGDDDYCDGISGPDWEAVIGEMRRLTPLVGIAELHAAYQALADAADGEG